MPMFNKNKSNNTWHWHPFLNKLINYIEQSLLLL